MANVSANEVFHFIADLVKHPADLAVQALLEDDAQPCRAKLLHPTEPGAFAVEKNSLAQFCGEPWFPEPVERDFVFLLHLVARMGELLCQVAVARQEEQPFGLGIEPADVEEPGKFRRQQVVDCVSRVRIASGRNKARRLVQEDGEILFFPNESVVNLDVVTLSDLRAEIGARLAVDRDPASRDQLVAMPA